MLCLVRLVKELVLMLYLKYHKFDRKLSHFLVQYQEHIVENLIFEVHYPLLDSNLTEKRYQN